MVATIFRSGYGSFQRTEFHADIPATNEPWSPGNIFEFHESGLFKADVRGDFELIIQIQDKDRQGYFSRLFQRYLASLIEIYIGNAMGGIQVPLGVVGSDFAGILASSIHGSQEERVSESVATSKRIYFRVRISENGHQIIEVSNPGAGVSLRDGILSVDLEASQDLPINGLSRTRPTSWLRKGQPIGNIKLWLDVEPG